MWVCSEFERTHTRDTWERGQRLPGDFACPLDRAGTRFADYHVQDWLQDGAAAAKALDALTPRESASAASAAQEEENQAA